MWRYSIYVLYIQVDCIIGTFPQLRGLNNCSQKQKKMNTRLLWMHYQSWNRKPLSLSLPYGGSLFSLSYTNIQRNTSFFFASHCVISTQYHMQTSIHTRTHTDTHTDTHRTTSVSQTCPGVWNQRNITRILFPFSSAPVADVSVCECVP